MAFWKGLFRDDAPASGLYNASIYPWSFVIWAYLSVARSYHSAIADHVQGYSEMLLQERMFDLPLVLCCMGTHICRALIPQCNAWPCSGGLLMEKSSQYLFTQSDMQRFRLSTPYPPHIQCWHRTTTQNARVCEQRKFRKAACCTYTPTLDIGARGLSYRCACKATWASRRR